MAFNDTGALALASSMLYPKTLAGAAVFSGWVALDKESFAAKITSAAKQVLISLAISQSIAQGCTVYILQYKSLNQYL